LSISENDRIELNDPLLDRIGDLADREHLQICVVGGYVRDLLLGTQGKDIDIVVVGKGLEFAKKVADELQARDVVMYQTFGTALMHYEGYKIEFVGARKESYDHDSRKPFVENGTLEDDLARRDFTVNAIAVSLNLKDRGKIHDPYNGRDDLKAGILRTPLDPLKTFDDDPLRIMRAMRFAARFDFSIEKKTFEATGTMAQRLKIVSGERIADEFLKLMASPKPSIGLKLMYQSGIMDVVFSEISMMAGVDQVQEFHHKDVFNHTLQVVDNVSAESDDLWLRMVALLHDVGKPRTKQFRETIGWTFHGHEEIGARMVSSIFKRMKFPLDKVDYLQKLIRLHLRPMALVDEEVTDSAVRRLLFDAGNDIDDLMILCRADITSKNPNLVQQVSSNYSRLMLKMEEVEAKDKLRNWQPPVDGEEIMKAFELQPGPTVGVLKQAMTDAILDGIIPNDHDAALSYLKGNYESILKTYDPKSKKKLATI
jgi:putative nucleotidyltransferase with HDIG domain